MCSLENKVQKYISVEYYLRIYFTNLQSKTGLCLLVTDVCFEGGKTFWLERCQYFNRFFASIDCSVWKTDSGKTGKHFAALAHTEHTTERWRQELWPLPSFSLSSSKRTKQKSNRKRKKIGWECRNVRGQGQKTEGGGGVKIQSILWENKHPQCGFHIHIFTTFHIFTWQWVSEGNIYQNLVLFLVITVLNFNGLSTFTVGQGKICGVGRASLRECVREQIHVVIFLFQ